MIGPNHAFSASGHSNLGDVSLARGKWPAALSSLSRGDPAADRPGHLDEIVRSIVEDEIRRSRHLRRPMPRGLAETRETGHGRAALMEETFAAAQQAWHTSAASALAKMTARLGASDTELGRRIRAGAGHVRPRPRAQRRGPEAARRMERGAAGEHRPTARCWRSSGPPASRAAGIRHRPSSGRGSWWSGYRAARALPARAEEGRLRERRPRARRDRQGAGRAVAGDRHGAGEIMAVHGAWRRRRRRCRATPSSPRGARRCAPTSTAPNGRPRARAQIGTAFPDYVALADPKPLAVAEVQALLRADEALVAILVGSEQELRVGRDARARGMGRDRRRRRGAGRACRRRCATASIRWRSRTPRARAGSRAGVVQASISARARALPAGAWARGPVFAGKRHLIVVPTGPLTSLPLQVLVTAPPGRQTGSRSAAQRGLADQEPCAERAAVGAVAERAAQARPAAPRRGRSSAWAIRC